MTLQDILNQVYPAIRDQGPAVEEYECRYRAIVEDKVRKCAAGMLIKDEFYSPDLEKQSVTTLEVIDVLTKSGVCMDTITIRFIRDLQTCHDRAAAAAVDNMSTFQRWWASEVEELIITYNLEMPK